MTKKLKLPLGILTVMAVFLAALLFLPLGAADGFAVTASAEAATITPSQPTTGDGSAGSPYEISNAAELYWFAGLVNGTLADGTAQNKAACAKLTENITVNEGVLKPDGTLNTNGSFTSWTPIGNDSNTYTGTFDGNGNTVSGLYFNNPSYFSGGRYAGLFGYIGNGGKVSEVGVVDSYFNGNDYVGGVCGSNYGTIESCYNTGIVSGSSYAGGVCGSNSGGTIDNCYNTGKVEASYKSVGGVCGTNSKSSNNKYKSTIKNCYNTGAVSGTNDHVGGVCGYNGETSTIENCHNTGEVSGKRQKVGGVCGYNYYSSDNYGIIKKCYNTGAVSGTGQYVGGLCGQNDGIAENCYNTGNVSGKDYYVGGLCGQIYWGTLQYSYNTGAVVSEKDSYVGIVCGNCNSSYGKINYCYYLGTAESDDQYDTTFKTEKQFKSGEVAYLLQGSQETDVWGQAIGTDDYPVLGGSKVYQTSPCVSYQNVKPTSTIAHKFSGADGICETCGYYQEATFNSSDNRYEISNAGQLYWFADKVNNDNENFGSKNAVLLEDITVNKNVLVNGELNTSEIANFRSWTPIGQDDTKKYTGTFDGNGKIISGLYFNESKIYVGLFGYIGGTIKDVGVVDSYLCGTNYVGGVCGYNTGTIQNCYNKGSVSGTGQYVGGVCGLNDNYSKIENCYNTGTVSGASNVGGVCGYNTVNSTITNCYNTGTVTATGYNASVGGVCGKNNYGTITNCYYDNTVYTGNAVGSDTNSSTTAYGKTEAQFNSGAVAYLLNGSKSTGDSKAPLAWYQNIDNEGTKDTYPVLDSTHGIVYQCTECTGVYSNTEGEPGSHTDSDKYNTNGFGICSVCGKEIGTYQPATDSDSDGVYEISNAGQLYWFADKVNNDNATYGNANAILTKDIVVNENLLSSLLFDESGAVTNGGTFRSWTPIGWYDNYDFPNVVDYPYTGTFDGQNHTISGLYFNDINTSYVGLFCNNRGTIQNVGVVDSYFNGTNVSGVCGLNEGGTIENCYNTGTVSGAECSTVGGVCGRNAQNGTISNCYNTGTVSAGPEANIGGVCGRNEGGTIENCYNTGAVSGAVYANVGGVCGCINWGTIANCYFDSTAYSGNAVGLIDGGTVSDNVIGKITAQFGSGEVAYLLSQGCTINGTTYSGEVWGQDLSTTTNYPVLDSTKKVYLTTPCPSYTNTANVTKEHKDVDGDEICDVCGKFADGIGAKLAGYTLSLNGNIGVNFYMELSEEIANSETAYMQFTLPNGEVTTVKVADVKDNYNTVNGKKCYIFPCEVSSFEMTKPIKAQMFDGNGNSGTEYSYTVRDYGKYIIDHPTSYEEKDVAFAKALLNYGAYSQAYFKVDVDDLANTSLDEAEKNVDEVTADSLAIYKVFSVSNDFGTFAGYSLTLKSETTLKVYFEPAADVDVSGLTFTAAGQTVTPVKSGKYYVLSVENIKAWNLDTSYDFSVSDGSETLNFSCSAMSYAYSVLQHSESYDNTLVKLISALRIYQQKAEVYVN